MAERPTMIKVLADMTSMLAQRSTCDRAHNGAIIFDSRGVILSGGYNGALTGMPHCKHPCDCALEGIVQGTQGKHLDSCTSFVPCAESMHAEANAVVWAARRGIATEGHSIMCTMSPCYRCAQLIIQAGITSVWFIEPYRDVSGSNLILEAGVRVLPVL